MGPAPAGLRESEREASGWRDGARRRKGRCRPESWCRRVAGTDEEETIRTGRGEDGEDEGINPDLFV